MVKRITLVLLCSCICLFFPADVLPETSNMESLVPKETPDGWVAGSDPQVFSKETLFEHINGQADLFLQYGFEKSVFAVYENKTAGQGTIDLDIYDMGDALHAFGVFSRFRQEDHPAGIGLESYLEDRYAFFYKGKYFVVLQATESTPASLKQLAHLIESRITDASLPPKEIGYFPKSGLKTGSIEYYPQGLMGHQFLKRGFKAIYLMPDSKPEAAAEGPDASLFLAIFDNSDEAEKALKIFEEDLSKKGGTPEAIRTPRGLEAMKGADVYQGKLIIARKGRYIVGTAGFERDKDAESLLTECIERIE